MVKELLSSKLMDTNPNKLGLDIQAFITSGHERPLKPSGQTFLMEFCLCGCKECWRLLVFIHLLQMYVPHKHSCSVMSKNVLIVLFAMESHVYFLLIIGSMFLLVLRPHDQCILLYPHHHELPTGPASEPPVCFCLPFCFSNFGSVCHFACVSHLMSCSIMFRCVHHCLCFPVNRHIKELLERKKKSKIRKKPKPYIEDYDGRVVTRLCSGFPL